jgi:hypothetical protein
MGIRFSCPNGHKLNVKAFLAGKRGVCPQCGAKFLIPSQTNSLDSEIGRSNTPGESRSVDVISPIPSQSSTLAASPSVIISVSETVMSTQSAFGSIAAPESGPLSSTLSPASNAGAQPLRVSTPIVADSASAHVARQERNRAKQIVISVVLLLVVIVLAVVLVLVLRRNTEQTAGTKVAAASHGKQHSVLSIAIAG